MAIKCIERNDSKSKVFMETTTSLNEIKTVYKAIKIIDGFDYSYNYSDDYKVRNKAVNERDNLFTILTGISNPKQTAILQKCFKDSCWNLQKVFDSDYDNLKNEIIEKLDASFRDDLRAIMRDIIGESSDIAKLPDECNNPRPLINLKHYGNYGYDIVCSFRYDKEKKDYILSAHPIKHPGEIDKDVTREIAVSDMSFKDVETLLINRAIKRSTRQVKFSSTKEKTRASGLSQKLHQHGGHRGDAYQICLSYVNN